MDQARLRALAAGAALLVAFAALTAAVAAGLPLDPDLALTRAIQAVPWPPLLAGAFGLVDYVDGPRQVALAAAVIAATYLLHRRTAVVALACSLSAAAYFVAELAVHRPRPPEALVHVVRHTSGFAYPSGHAVFYLWALTVLALAVAARRRSLWAPAAVLAALFYAAVLVGRVETGEHWPTDCLGGLLLGAGWTLAAIGLVGEADRHRLPLGEAVQHPFERELPADS